MRYFFILTIVSILLHNTYADTVYLKNGNQVTGQVIQKDKSGVTVKMAFGKIFIARKDIRKIARESFERTVIAQSNRLIFLGADYQAISHLKRAIRKYPKKQKLKDALADLYFQLGRKYTQRNPKKALQLFTKAQKINPQIDISSYKGKISQIQHKALEIQKRAEKFLQSKNYKEALKEYEKAIELNPDLQTTSAQMVSHCASQIANDLFKTQKFTEALKYYELALQQYPKIYPYIEQPWLYSKTQFIGKEYILKSNWNSAIVELREILKHRPDYSPALFLTATCLEKLKDYKTAFEYYNSATKNRQNREWDGKFTSLEQERLRAQQVVNRQTLQPFFVPQDSIPTKDWIKSTTAHFNIYYQNKELAQKIASTLEFHWSVIFKKLAPKDTNNNWPMRCDVYIFPSRKEYMKNTGLPQWSDGVSQMAYQQGRLFQHKIHLYASAPLLLSNIIPHELTHVMLPWFLKYRVQLPLWLNEGVAMTNEASFRTNSRRFTLKRALKRGSVFPVAQLLNMNEYPSSQEKASIFYSQSLSIVEFLLKRGGNAKLLQFTKKAKSDIKIALKETYSIPNFSTLERLWLKYANE
ncbi:tetratricopeptide repeat protein [Candidatus Uabimicrobium sp. HlEnr_7]|uniref:tetratricopeptide repeat protein n=1 Tax=Candidatus Uabimicrobium helgolandensis TaxID=3095367 RepID=UPI003555FF9C